MPDRFNYKFLTKEKDVVTIGMNYKMIPGKEKVFEDAFNEFIQSEKFKNVVNWGKENILAGRPSHTVYKH